MGNLRDLGWILPAVGALLRRLGGFQWKWAWRYVGPIFIAITAFGYKHSWWYAALAAVLIGLVSSLGLEGAWATDWRILLVIGQGFLSGMALWPLVKPGWLWAVACLVCAVGKSALLALSNNIGMPHGLFETGWGFVWYGMAAWMIVQTKQEDKL